VRDNSVVAQTHSVVVARPAYRRPGSTTRFHRANLEEKHFMFKQVMAGLLALFAAAAFAAVDVNKATAAELDGVKGIGAGISGKILEERKKGNFKDWNDLIERVKGIGEGNAAKFSAEGMTVNGAAFKGVAATPAAAKKEDKPMAGGAKKEDKPMAAAAAAPAAAKPAAAAAPAPAAEKKADAKADAKADKKTAEAKPDAKADKKDAKAKPEEAAKK
jgi:competence protein ComEA